CPAREASRSARCTARSFVAPRRELDVLEHERLDVALAVRPHRDVAEALVIALGLAVAGLVLDAEMAAAALLAHEPVLAPQLGELEVVGDAPGLLERLVER